MKWIKTHEAPEAERKSDEDRICSESLVVLASQTFSLFLPSAASEVWNLTFGAEF